jgi:hypothetical protein
MMETKANGMPCELKEGDSIDRGTPVTVTFILEGDPEGIDFIYTRPGETRPIVDEGYGNPGSQIRRVGPLGGGIAYQAVIDTDKFETGVVQGHFVSSLPYKASRFFSFHVRSAPRQLL